MTQEPVISFCIPTFNRKKYLKRCIESIIHQNGFSNKIEIMVYSDPSSDGTNLMIKEYLKKYNNIKYHENKNRIGMIPSILESIEMCSGEYIRLFSDDDILNEGSLEIMLNLIIAKKPGLILSKMLGFRNEYEIKFRKPKTDSLKVSIMTGIYDFFDFLSGLNYSIHGYLAHCSLFCFQKSLYLSNLNYILKTKGDEYINILKCDYFAHIRIIYLPYGNKNNIIVVSEDMVLVQGLNISRNFKFKVCKDFGNLINDLKSTYNINKITYTKMKKIYYYNIFCYIIITHISKFLPRSMYCYFLNLGRKIMKLIKIG